MASTRPIKTIYYHRKEVVKVNVAAYANSAVLRCVDHMQLNSYGATAVEVFDTVSGTLHAVVKRRMNGDIEILFRHDNTEGS